MSTGVADAATPTSSRIASRQGPSRRLGRAQLVLVVLEGSLSLCGVAGGIYLMARPFDAIPVRYLEGTWFASWRWPGLALLVFVGICPALAAGAQLRRLPVAPIGHLCVGAGMVAWIALEAAWVVVSPPMQISMGLVGLIILALAIAEIVNGRGTSGDPI